MAQIVHLFDPPDRFVVGTVGEPGQRAFFLQAREGMRLVTVGIEKQQVEILAARMAELIEEVREADPSVAAPREITEDLIDMAALDQPIEEEFRAGTITLSWDATTKRVVIEVFSITDQVVVPMETDESELPSIEVEEPEPDELLTVRITPTQALLFSGRAGQVVNAGRPQCQFCGGPIDPDGHLCPRANGFRRRA